MNFSSLLHWLNPGSKPSNPKTKPNPRSYRPKLETLEDRVVPTWTVNTLGSPAALVQNLTGGSDPVSNISYTGAYTAAGTFYDTQGVVGIRSGVVLSSGSARGVAGPNNNAAYSASNNTPNDPDLDAIINPITGADAAVLQFTWTPRGRYATFSFVFGSEEYPDFTPPVSAGGFGDVFAFYVNGVNQALVPGTTSAITTDNVNSAINPAFYRDNYGNPNGPIFGHQNTQMNGYTTVISVTLDVTPGVSNQIKLGIENGFDQLYDSWVLIQAGSLKSYNVPTLAPSRYIYTPATNIFSGDFYVVNPQSVTIPGPNYLIFLSLPPGVSITDATGTTASGHRYFALGSLPGSGSIRVHVNVRDPLHLNLGTTLNHSPLAVSSVLF